MREAGSNVERVFAEKIEEIGDQPLRDLIKRFNGWPVVVGRDWSRPNQSLEQYLGKLRGLYNLGILMELWIGPDDKNSSVNIIQVIAIGFPIIHQSTNT